MIPIFGICQQSANFRLEAIKNRQIDGFQTEGCSFTQSNTSNDKILLMSFNGMVAAKIKGKIFTADFTFNESGRRASFIGNQINGI